MKQVNNDFYEHFNDRLNSVMMSVALFFVTIVVFGVGVIWLLQTIGINEMTRGVLASLASVLLFSITLFRFNYEKMKLLFKNRMSIGRFLIITLTTILFLLLVNYITLQILNYFNIGKDSINNYSTNSINKGIIILILNGVILSPIVEELAFRAGLKNLLVDFGKWQINYYILISGCLFSLLHYNPGYSSIIVLITTFIIGITLAYVYIKTNNIMIVIISHMVYNLIIIIYSLQ